MADTTDRLARIDTLIAEKRLAYLHAAHNLDADEAFALAADVDRLLDLRNRVQRGELAAVAHA